MSQSDANQYVLRLLTRFAHELERAGPLTQTEMRQKIRSLCQRILDRLDEAETTSRTAPDADVFDDLDRQSQEIASELRRVERLMKQKARD